GLDGLQQDPDLNGVDHVEIFDAGGDHDVLVLNDRGGETSQITQSIDYLVTDSSVTRTTVNGYWNQDGLWVSSTTSFRVNTQGFEEVHLFGIDAPASYKVESTAANQAFTLHTGRYADTVTVGGDRGLDDLQSPLNLDDSGGTDSLIVNDQANP